MTDKKVFPLLKSFYEAAMKMPDKKSAGGYLLALCAYYFEEELPEMDAWAQMAFELSKPNIDVNKKKGKRNTEEIHESSPAVTAEIHESNSADTDGSPLQIRSHDQGVMIKDKGEMIKDQGVMIEGQGSGGAEDSSPPRAQKEKNKKSLVRLAENVSMSAEEHEKLLSAHGPQDTARLIEILDNYKGSTGKKYKSDYHAILSWCEDRLIEEKRKSAKQQRSSGFETAAEYEAEGGFTLGESELASIQNLKNLRDSFANP